MNGMFGVWLAFSCGVLLQVGTSNGHEDTILEYVDGELKGLPEEFQPAEFDLKRKVLSIGGRVVKFPDTLRSLFPDEQKDPYDEEGKVREGVPFDLKFSASWYHGPSTSLPPYMLISISPKGRDFHSEILVDIESLSFLRAHVFLKITNSRTEVIPVQIEEPRDLEQRDDDWYSIIGKWRSPGAVIEISETSIKATIAGEPAEYPNGKISPAGPGMMNLETTDGAKERFSFRLKGNILFLGLQRIGGVELARIGSPEDKAAMRRLNEK